VGAGHGQLLKITREVPAETMIEQGIKRGRLATVRWRWR